MDGLKGRKSTLFKIPQRKEIPRALVITHNNNSVVEVEIQL